MKMIYKNLCSIIMDLQVIGENLDSFRKEMEIATPRLSMDDYPTILFASNRIKKTMEILERMKNKTESVTSTA